jgi:hypothetical protein
VYRRLSSQSALILAGMTPSPLCPRENKGKDARHYLDCSAELRASIRFRIICFSACMATESSGIYLRLSF